MTNSIIFRHDSASAVVRCLSDGIYTVTNVWSEKPGQGHASAVMKDLASWADRNRVILLLVVQAYGPPDRLSNRDLEVFYEKFGFCRQPEFPRPPHRMIREPSQELQGV